MIRAIDLFAGPGGWDEGIRPFGIRPLGIEWDEAACQTRLAAGHPTMKADIAELDPREFGPCDLLIASPPCQSFSMAGKRKGAKDAEAILRSAHALPNDIRGEVEVEDARSLLAVEPLRWAFALRPTWLVFEEVPPVLKIWEEFAGILEQIGYSTWTGILKAEQFGVPQTRRRAFLMATLVSQVKPPKPTHREYKKGVPQHEARTLGETLLEPWVSMAEALGWGMIARPSMTVTAGGGSTGGAEPFGNGARKAMAKQPWFGQARNSGPGAARDPRDLAAPSYTIRTHGSGSHPSGVEWTMKRPSTTVNCDPRISQPGRHDPNESGSQQKNAIRVTVQEAAVLQSFPADYPWQGTKGKQFEQVGNAVPPLLARAVIEALVGAALLRRAA